MYELFADDCYRLSWFTQGLAEDACALDVGAHVGSFSLRFASRRPRGQVASYEAMPSTNPISMRMCIATDSRGG